ncbi:MAG: sulfatase-like hydrolase/transferase, partial [Pirellulales bacterium]|nr:sulfatase-like hydrolase/transferase [Pirellulales bacterium]
MGVFFFTGHEYAMTPFDNKTLSRRRFLGLLGATALGAACSSPEGDKSRVGKKPNILFIAVDDLRPQLGCFGRGETISPHIDGLAARGALFERAYCSVPVCGPSRVSVLTGIRTAANQWKCNDLKRDFTTLPAHLKRHGYHTLSNGKVFHHLHDRCDDWSEPPWRSAKIYHGEKDWAGYNAYGIWQDEGSARAVNPKTGRGPYCEA